MSHIEVKSAPFAHAPNGLRAIMTTVLLALVPAVLFNCWLFGWPAILLFAITVGACLAFEAGCTTLAGKPAGPAVGDGSAALTGVLLAMSLPPWAPWWIGVLGAFIAIALAKHVYGGIGRNLFNPAMVARVALLVSFPVIMTAWVAPKPIFSPAAPGFIEALAITGGAPLTDAMTSATPLGYVKTELSRGVAATQSILHIPALSDLALGLRAGSLGETSAILILVGGLFLMARRIISWHIPVAMLGSLFVMASLFHLGNPARFSSGFFHLLSGASFLGAFFIATDYVTSPVSKKGQLIFGAGVGILTWVIRNFAGYPEGMAFAVLLMNSLTPIIDQYTRPRIFGRDKKGEPLALNKEGAR